MRTPFFGLFFVAAALLAPTAGRGQSLLENGKFNNAGDPFKGWVTDYEWTGNSNYVGNKAHVSIASDGARKTAVKMDSPGETGVKMESRPFPFEPGFRYTGAVDVKGGGYRIYFGGYKWAPGIHPHDNPELSELRMIYMSKAVQAESPGAWKQEKIELPGVKLSAEALAHLKDIRFLTFYIWFNKPGFVDNASVTKVADPTLKF
jgi:hypothetical protein